jgi:NADH-quinone oxidoreductase subunit D
MAEMWINMGPQHPATHGLWDLRIKVDGDMILDADPQIGYIHRGIEKLGENRNYTQFIPLADRTGYASPMTWAILYVLTVEELMDIKVPPRATYIRTIAFELQRMASHLLFVYGMAENVGAMWPPLVYAYRERELLLDLFQILTGARFHFNYPRIGGVKWDIPQTFEAQTKKALDVIESKLKEYERMFDESEIFLMRTKGVAVLRKEDAIRMGVTGPTLRACGVKEDLRKSEPYMCYSDFDFGIPTGKNGDLYDRWVVRIAEIRESAKIVRQALDRIPGGAVATKVPAVVKPVTVLDGETGYEDLCVIMAKVPKVIKPPPGEAYVRVEDSRGESAMYIISDGTERPYRIKIRSPIFCTLSALKYMMKGARIADVPPIMEGIDILLSEVDR